MVEWLDRVYCGDSRRLTDIPANSVHLTMFSPPYGVNKSYEVGMNWGEWWDLMNQTIYALGAKITPGGRVAVNVANIGRQPYRTLHASIWRILTDGGFEARAEVIWHKGASVGTSTAWGSWRSPTAPTMRDVHEYILIAQKPGRYPGKGQSDITASEFMEYTKSIWTMPTVSAKRIGHEAPFPLELPRRLIRLYTYPGDTVLDPMCGSGTTLLAAKELGRHYIGVDSDPAAVALAEDYLTGKRVRPDALVEAVKHG